MFAAVPLGQGTHCTGDFLKQSEYIRYIFVSPSLQEGDGVTPTEQANLRSKRRAASSGKRGRPPKNKGEAKGSPKPRAKKKAAPKALPKKRSTKPIKASPKRKPAPRASKKPKACDGDEPGTPPDEEGDGAPRQLGCGRCRYASKGCLTCKNPKYRPHKRNRK